MKAEFFMNQRELKAQKHSWQFLSVLAMTVCCTDVMECGSAAQKQEGSQMARGSS